MKTTAMLCAAGLSLVLATGATRADLNAGLALYYSFNDAGPGTVADESGNGRHGVILGGAEHVDGGRIGGAYFFDGVDDAINIPSAPPAGAAYSISLWFTSASYANFEEGRQLVSDNRRYQLGAEILDGAQRLFTYAPNFADFGPAVPLDTTPLCIEDGVWHHVVMTADEAVRPAVVIYVDGKQVAAGTGDGVNAGGIQFLIGALNNGGGFPGSFWNGMIDEVRVHSRAISHEEVLELYALADPPVAAVSSALRVGLSNDPDGPQDVTQFVADEVLHIRVDDVYFLGTDPKSSYAATLKRQGPKAKGPVRVDLAPQEDGSYRGSVPLDGFGAGKVKILIEGTTKNGDKRSIESSITIL